MIKKYLFLPTPSTSTSYRDSVRFEAHYESNYGLGGNWPVRNQAGKQVDYGSGAASRQGQLPQDLLRRVAIESLSCLGARHHKRDVPHNDG